MWKATKEAMERARAHAGMAIRRSTTRKCLCCWLFASVPNAVTVLTFAVGAACQCHGELGLGRTDRKVRFVAVASQPQERRAKDTRSATVRRGNHKQGAAAAHNDTLCLSLAGRLLETKRKCNSRKKVRKAIPHDRTVLRQICRGGNHRIRNEQKKNNENRCKRV